MLNYESYDLFGKISAEYCFKENIVKGPGQLGLIKMMCLLNNFRQLCNNYVLWLRAYLNICCNLKLVILVGRVMH